MDAGTAANAAIPAVVISSASGPWRAWMVTRVLAGVLGSIRGAWRALRNAVLSWIAEQRRTIESTGIKFAIVCSLAMFAGCAAYHFGTLGMVGSDVFFHYAMLLALLYCSLAYQFNRFGAARRREEFQTVPAAEIPWRDGAVAPSVTILIPSYREERRVLIGTVLSAALAE